MFTYSNFTAESGAFEIALTVTLVLQATQITKCTSQSLGGKSKLGTFTVISKLYSIELLRTLLQHRRNDFLSFVFLQKVTQIDPGN